MPYNKLKTIQYWLINAVFEKLTVHSSAMAYVRNKSIKQNAIAHLNRKYLLKLDLKDFFPSIKSSDLLPLLQAWHREACPAWEFNKEATDIIERSCFDMNKMLPQGYATSPIISNIVMSKFDSTVTASLESQYSGEVVYTRYADDMIFSTNQKGRCSDIYTMVKLLIENSQSPKLQINSKKTKYVSGPAGSAIVTGLRVITDSHFTIRKKHKDHVRLMLSLYSKGVLNKKEFNVLRGHLNYIKHVAPAFYTKLQAKHYLAIDSLLGLS